MLEALGAHDAVYLGHGGEAAVFALDESRVVRVLWPGGELADLEHRQVLVDELGRSGAPFALPEVLTTGEVDGRAYAVERRHPGRSVNMLLAESEGRKREALVIAYLETAAALGDLELEPRQWYGELIAASPV